MALQKRTDVETSELKGVVLAVDETKIKPGVFVQLSNWIPFGVGSIIKKRGVASLATIATTPVAPVEDCADPTEATPPAAPSNLVATTVDFFSITITWDDNSANETSFSLERCTGSGCTNFIPVASIDANTETYTDSFLDPSTNYSYRIQAVNAGGVSGYSNTDDATTTALPVDPPSANLSVWLDSSQIVGFANNDPLDVWEDQSGEGNDFTATLTARPTYKTTSVTINGLPVVSFDGVNDLLSNTSLDTSLWTAATVFMIGRCNVDPAIDISKTGHWKFNPIDVDASFPYVDGGIYENAFTTVRKTIGDVTSALDQPFLYTIVSNADVYKVRINKVEVFSTNVNTFVGQNGGVSANLLGGSNSFFYNGVMAILLVFEGELTDQEIAVVEAVLSVQWDL